MIPRKIRKIVKGYKRKKDNIGCSSDDVYVYENKYILKISKDQNRLERDCRSFTFINSNLGKYYSSYAFIRRHHKVYYLRELIKGYSLIDLRYINDPERLVRCAAKAYQYLRSFDGKCNFDSFLSKGKHFIHGDLCLPNIYFDENDNLIGFIDNDNAGNGDYYYDIAWFLWSLEYNLKTKKYNKLFLDLIGEKFDETWYHKYINQRYEDKIKQSRTDYNHN